MSIFKAFLSAVRLAIRSFIFDIRLMRVRKLPLWWRVRFVIKKYSTLLRLGAGRSVLFEILPISMLLRDISGLGTLQSNIVDFSESVLSSCEFGPMPLIVDIGANIGQFVNAAKLFFPEAKVISFEPDPGTYADLETNTASLRKVDVYNIGLSDRDGTLPFYRRKLSVMSGFNSPLDDAGDGDFIELPVRSLDAVLHSNQRPDLLKIDVEGFERQVLGGAWGTVARSRYLLIELSLDRADGGMNLELLHDIVEHVADATIVRFGRPLGDPDRPTCQDVLISVQERAHVASAPGSSDCRSPRVDAV